MNTKEQNFEQLNSEMKTQSENHQRELLEITRVKEELESSLEREVKQRTELEARNEQLAASFEEKQRESDDVREKFKSKELLKCDFSKCASGQGLMLRWRFSTCLLDPSRRKV